MVNGWKVTAIIFIVLFILETILLAYAWKLGVDEIEKETECAYNICYGYDSYSYNRKYSLCQCYEDSGKVKTEYLRK